MSGKAYIQMPKFEDTSQADAYKTMAEMLQSQYISTHWDDVIAATEVHAHEIPLMAAKLMNRFILGILSADESALSGIDEDRKLKALVRIELKKRILSDTSAMMYTIIDSYEYAFMQLRKSMERQSRGEARDIATAQLGKTKEGDELNFQQRTLAKLGLGQHETVYREK